MKGFEAFMGGDNMDDRAIIELYNQRNEEAISETQKKYGRYCHYIAYNILCSYEDSEECVNDSYLKVWNSIPPHAPDNFCAYIGKITRNTALDRYEQLHTQKRANAQLELALDELAETLPSDGEDMSQELLMKEAINSFLASLPKRTRIIFMRRYWYLCSVKDIALDLGISESNVKVTLMRTREKFKAHLEKKGVTL